MYNWELGNHEAISYPDPPMGENIVSENNLINPDGGIFYDPTRTVASYHASIGGQESLEAFLAGAREQSKHNNNWRVEYTANAVNTYLREGFTVVGGE